MTFLEQFDEDIGSTPIFATPYYMFCDWAGDMNMIGIVRHHLAVPRLFIFCRSPLHARSGHHYNSNIHYFENRIDASGHCINEISSIYLDELVDLDSLEKAVKEKYGRPNYHPMTYKYYSPHRPCLRRYSIYLSGKSSPIYDPIIIYDIVYNSIAFSEFLISLNEQFVNKLRLGLIIEQFDNWYGKINLLNPKNKFMREINPEYIISPKIFWLPVGKRKSYFSNWRGIFANPETLLDYDDLVICWKKELYDTMNESIPAFRCLKEVGLV